MDRTMPSKESVREWLRQEVSQHRPPPDPQQIRRELGWGLIARAYRQRDVAMPSEVLR
jgi:hypothetical protein